MITIDVERSGKDKKAMRALVSLLVMFYLTYSPRYWR